MCCNLSHDESKSLMLAGSVPNDIGDQDDTVCPAIDPSDSSSVHPPAYQPATSVGRATRSNKKSVGDHKKYNVVCGAFGCEEEEAEKSMFAKKFRIRVLVIIYFTM